MHRNRPMQRFAIAKLHIKILAMVILRLLMTRTNIFIEFPNRANISTIHEHTRRASEPSKSPHGLNASASGLQITVFLCARGGCVITGAPGSTQPFGFNVSTGIPVLPTGTCEGSVVVVKGGLVDDILVVVTLVVVWGQYRTLVFGELGGLVPISPMLGQ